MDRLVTAPARLHRLPQRRPLPPLRPDLKRYPGAPDRDGTPAWIVEDPVANRFFRIGRLDAALLDHWALGDPARIAAAVAGDCGVTPTADEVAALAGFLQRHELVVVADADGVDRLAARARAARAGWWSALLHHYLFFRIPLVRPARLLRALLPWFGWWWHPAFTALAGAATVLGLVLALRQWDDVVHTAVDWASPAGLLAVAVALALAKAVHELGHALTATRFGVRVGHMGIAFLVLWPMLYTDTGESWKLVDRRRRFAIAAAGIRAELLLAGFATLGWSLVDDGPLREGLFLLATTSWVMTLAINASPFMRFDGYFLLSDALDLPNLHARAFALARAALRRGLLGWDEPDPEPFAPSLRRGLVVFAWLTWLYRLVLFVGIALAVYHVFFKALGVLLLAVELTWFIGRPVAAELAVWARGRRRTQAGHAAWGLLALVAVLALLALPWPTGITAQGWLHAARSQRIHAPAPARIEHLQAPGPVPAGAELVRLDSPPTRHRLRLAELEAASIARRIDRSVGRDDGAVRRLRLTEDLAERRAAAAAERGELDRLTVAAAFDGVVTDVEPALRPGVWVAPQQTLLVLVDPRDWVVEALVTQQEVGRIRPGAPARFRPWRGLGPTLAGEVVAIDPVRVQRLSHPLFAAEHGGRLPTRGPDPERGAANGAGPGGGGAAGGSAAGRPAVAGREAAGAGDWGASLDGGGLPVPRDPLYRVRIRIAAPGTLREASGQVIIDGEPRSLLAGWLRQAASVLIRESGF